MLEVMTRTDSDCVVLETHIQFHCFSHSQLTLHGSLHFDFWKSRLGCKYITHSYTNINYKVFLHGCTMHVDNIKSFICPTNANTNYSKTAELLKTSKSKIIAPTCFGLHKPSSGSSQSVLHQSYNIDFSVYISLMKFSVLWLHILFHPVVCINCALCTAQCTIHTYKEICSQSTDNFMNNMYTLKSTL